MASGSSVLSRVLAVPSWAVAVVMLAAVFGVGAGPETYFGVDGDLLQWVILGLFALYALAGAGVSDGTGVETNPETPAAVGEHYRPTTETHRDGGYHDDTYRAGIHRVVGAGDRVALLRVGDADGRRVHDGEVAHVDQSTLDEDFEAATDPDASFTPVAGVKNALTGLYWNVARYR